MSSSFSSELPLEDPSEDVEISEQLAFSSGGGDVDSIGRELDSLRFSARKYSIFSSFISIRPSEMRNNLAINSFAHVVLKDFEIWE